LADAIAGVAAREGRAGLLVTKNGCPLLAGVSRDRLSSVQDCAAFSEAALYLIDGDPALTGEILVAWWALYT